MSEIAKCPLCGKDVKKSIWRPEYEGCAGSVVITVKCCGMEALTVELWNQYAAAMELANSEAWETETDEVRAYLDDTLEDCDAWEEIVDTNIAAERAAFDARDRVLEVFNG